jgi:hypothetical protein
MKKYKLIKKYPGSPILNTIVEQRFNILICYRIISPVSKPVLSKEIIENSPEFWEEIIEKDYDILSVLLRRSADHVIRKVDLNDSKSYIESLIKCDGNSIHSIRRLSDNEIFTVGDKIKTSVTDNYCAIYNLLLNNTGKLLIDCTHSYLAHKKGVDLLSDIQHIKKPLFTTEDGVDIFDTDEVYGVELGSFRFLHYIVVASDITKNYIKCVHFSTREKAEEYIIRNKPCLSLHDIDNCWAIEQQLERSRRTIHWTKTIRNLTKLIKERI